MLISFLIRHSETALTEQIDREEYNPADLVEVKVTLNAPYFGSWHDYERYDGEVIIDGVSRHYVKRKIESDTLYLLCLPNKIATKLIAARSSFERSAPGSPAEKKDGGLSIKKPACLNQYQEQISSIVIAELPHLSRQHFTTLSTSLLHSFIALPVEPPEVKS